MTKGCYRLEKEYNKLPLTVATENKVTPTGNVKMETWKMFKGNLVI